MAYRYRNAVAGGAGAVSPAHPIPRLMLGAFLTVIIVITALVPSGRPAQAEPLSREQMHGIIEQVIDPAEINFDGCAITQRLRSNMGSNAQAEFGCQRSEGDSYENFSLKATLIARAHSSQVCDKPYKKIEDDNRLGDRSCTLFVRGPETTAAGTSQLEMRYEIFDALENGDKIAVSVKIQAAASAANPPIDAPYLTELASAYAERLYVPLRSMTLGRGMKMARRALPGARADDGAQTETPADRRDVPQQTDEAAPRVLTIDNQTDLRLRFKHYFATPDGVVFRGGPGHKELRINYPVETVIGPHASQSFQANLPPTRARVVYQPGLVNELYKNGERIYWHRPYEDIFMERVVTYEIEADTDYQTLTIRPENIRTFDDSPNFGFPADLYIENNLDVPIRVHLQKRPVSASAGFDDPIEGVINWSLEREESVVFQDEHHTLEPGGTLFSNNRDLWPGSNTVLIKADEQVSPWQVRDGFRRVIVVPTGGIEMLDRRFEIIVTEKDFTE